MKNKGGKFVLAGIVGAVTGAISGLLLAPKSGKETRADIVNLAKKIQTDIKTGTVETKSKVEEIFGNATAEAVAKFEKIKKAVVDKIAAAKTAGKKIDKESYSMIVDDVITEFKDDLSQTKDGVKKMAQMLKKDWEKIKKSLA
jgi:gas vesicle protein